MDRHERMHFIGSTPNKGICIHVHVCKISGAVVDSLGTCTCKRSYYAIYKQPDVMNESILLCSASQNSDPEVDSFIGSNCRKYIYLITPIAVFIADLSKTMLNQSIPPNCHHLHPYDLSKGI